MSSSTFEAETVEREPGPAAEPVPTRSPQLGRSIALLLFVHFALMIFALVATSHAFGLLPSSRIVVATDAARYHEIAHTPGIPYRDFQVEYPPATLGIIELFGHGTTGATATLLGLFGFAMDGLVALLLVL